MKNFALIGAAGFIAPRHLKAIKETQNNLVAALDKFDQVGVLDSYFPNADFFTEFERFDRHLDKLKRNGIKIDFVSICTPNYLHDSHIRFALRHHANAICEKPLVLNPWNVDALSEIQKETNQKVFTILQLRHHVSIIALRELVKNGGPNKIYDVDLSYITSRGNWYQISWKGDPSKSGGVSTNIGIHFFDMLIWVFGKVQKNVVNVLNENYASGYLELEQARVRWFLSINYDHIPESVKAANKRTYRSITVDGKEIEFSEGFTDLHTVSYRKILEGEGYGLADAAPAIQVAHDIRHGDVLGKKGEFHPFLRTLGI